MANSSLLIFKPVLVTTNTDKKGRETFKMEVRGRVFHRWAYSYFPKGLEWLWVTGREGVKVKIETLPPNPEGDVECITSHGGFFVQHLNLYCRPGNIVITADTETQNVDISDKGESCVYQRQPRNENVNIFAAISHVNDTIFESRSGSNVFTTVSDMVFGKTLPVNDIARFYRDLKEGHVDFFYVSDTSITSLLDTYNYPKAPLYLNDYRGAGSISEGHKKMERLDQIVTGMPRSQFFLFGDNTTHDISEYLALAQRFPNRINTIYIRVVPRGKFSARAIRALWERGPELEVGTVPNDGMEYMVKTLDVIFWTDLVDVETDCRAKMAAAATLSQEWDYLRIHFRRTGWDTQTYTTAVFEEDSE